MYNANGIDGSTVTTVSFVDSSPDRVEINVATSLSISHIYAAWVYYAFTATGIATDIDYIRAIDGANYEFSNMVIKNTSSPSVPLKLIDGYLWDVTTGDPMDCIDTSGGTIFLAPPHVVVKTITLSGSNVITGDIDDVTAKVQAGLSAQGLTTSKVDSLLTTGKFLGLK